MYLYLVSTLALVLVWSWVGESEGKDFRVTPTYPSLYKTTWPTSEKPRPDPAPAAKEDVFISPEDEERIIGNQEELEISVRTDQDAEFITKEDEEEDMMKEESRQEEGDQEVDLEGKGEEHEEQEEEGAEDENKPVPRPEHPAALYHRMAQSREELQYDNNLDQLDFCPKQITKMTLKVYCRHLADGLYYDPWNPYCGYINCTQWLATRVYCNDGSWLGTRDELLSGVEFICRKPLTEAIVSRGQCPHVTDHNVCQEAKRVELMNPVHGVKVAP